MLAAPPHETHDEPSASHIVDVLLAWFAENGRPWPWRATRDRWCVLVAEVCLQQTQVMRAAGYVERILTEFPTPAELAAAPLHDLLAMWTGLGYPRRARNLWLAAQQIAVNGWPEQYEDLPGVGAYTGAALRCFADEQAVVPMDINTRRVAARLFPHGLPSAELSERVVSEAWQWGQAVMELGQRVCRARALCDECPVAALCPSSGTTTVIASPRQSRYEGSMRQRRGVLLRRLTTDGYAPVAADTAAADGLVADGLAELSADGCTLVPVLSDDRSQPGPT